MTLLRKKNSKTNSMLNIRKALVRTAMMGDSLLIKRWRHSGTTGSHLASSMRLMRKSTTALLSRQCNRNTSNAPSSKSRRRVQLVKIKLLIIRTMTHRERLIVEEITEIPDKDKIRTFNTSHQIRKKDTIIKRVHHTLTMVLTLVVIMSSHAALIKLKVTDLIVWKMDALFPLNHACSKGVRHSSSWTEAEIQWEVPREAAMPQ